MALKNLKLNKKVIILIAIIVLLFFLYFIKLLAPIENVIVQVLAPVQVRLYGVTKGISNFFGEFSECQANADENMELKQELIDKSINIAKLKELEEENITLKNLLNFLHEKKFNAITGRVIGRSDTTEYSSIIINLGTDDGVKEGQAVISEEGVMVGKVNEAFSDYSVVLYVTDDHSSVAASVLNNDKTIGIVEGQYGLSCTMGLIPQNEEINENDLVVTSGIEENVPSGLIIGEVDKVTNEKGDLFKTASIKLLIDLKKVKIVSVLIE